jgi:hypothetical protein
VRLRRLRDIRTLCTRCIRLPPPSVNITQKSDLALSGSFAPMSPRSCGGFGINKSQLPAFNTAQSRPAVPQPSGPAALLPQTPLDEAAAPESASQHARGMDSSSYRTSSPQLVPAVSWPDCTSLRYVPTYLDKGAPPLLVYMYFLQNLDSPAQIIVGTKPVSVLTGSSNILTYSA